MIPSLVTLIDFVPTPFTTVMLYATLSKLIVTIPSVSTDNVTVTVVLSFTFTSVAVNSILSVSLYTLKSS